MPKDAIKEAIQYGNWSGPGWTAGGRDEPFRDKGISRSLTDQDRHLPGIDPYDNFVAKPHDLNEFDAEERLRGALAGLGLVSDQLNTDEDGRLFYPDRLVFGDDPGVDEGHRFVSFKTYIARQAAEAPGETNARLVRSAFCNYFLHIAKSNCQFGVDHIRNDPRLGFVDSFLSFFKPTSIRKQLLGAAVIFLEEAKTAENRVNDEVLVGIDDKAEYGAAFDVYIQENFVSPVDPNFAPVGDQAFLPTLTKAAITAASRDELLKAGVALRSLENSKGSDRLFREAPAGGFPSVAALHEAIDEQ